MKAILLLLVTLHTNYNYLLTSVKVPNSVRVYSETAGRRLMNCCSRCTDRFGTEIVKWEYLAKTKRYKIEFIQTWVGCTTLKYKLHGILLVDKDGCNSKWDKIEDSGAFLYGCGTKCDLGCLE